MKVCGDCEFAHPVKQADGTLDFTKRTCFGFPPTIMMAPSPRGPVPIGVRNTVELKDHACSLYKAKISLDLKAG